MRGGTEIMKKILLGIYFGLICNFANADVKVVNDITDVAKINWGALDSAVINLSTDDIRADMMVFFIEHEKDELSAKDILSYCLTIDSKNACANFVKTYMDYVGGNANDCTEASAFVGRLTQTLGGGFSYRFETFQDALNYCEVHGHGSHFYNDKHEVVYSDSYKTDSIYGLCERFIEYVKKCTIHLETYYEQELLSETLSNKTRKQYQCILNLVKTGQLNLPVNLMEKSCK